MSDRANFDLSLYPDLPMQPMQHVQANPPMLPLDQFRQAVEALPLVSVDWILTEPDGNLLLGKRLNTPASGAWFSPGGRIRKGESLTAALQRVAQEELGALPESSSALVKRAKLMGAWDHFYPDAAFSPTIPTHYVNLPHWVALTQKEVDCLNLPVGVQHSQWQWMPLAVAAQSAHHYVQPYVAWLMQFHMRTE